MIAGMVLADWRRRGEECAGDALRADPDAAGEPVALDEAVGVLEHLGLWGDDQIDAQLVAEGIDPTEEHRAQVRGAVREGYTSRMLGQ